MSCWRSDRGLPRCNEDADVLLEIPDVRQAADYDCGTACVDAVLRFHGLRTCAAVLDMANPVQGTSPDTIEALLRRAGLRVASGNLTVDDLKHFARTGRPVVCCVQQGGAGHWVVVRGVDRAGVHFHCPVAGAGVAKRAFWSDHWYDATRSGHEFDRWGIAAG